MRKRKGIFALCLLLAFFSGALCALGQDAATEGGQTPATETSGGTPTEPPVVNEQPVAEQPVVTETPILESPPADQSELTGQPNNEQQEENGASEGQLPETVSGEPQVASNQPANEEPATEELPDGQVISEEQPVEQPKTVSGQPETPAPEGKPEGSVSAEATVTIVPNENPIVQNLRTADGINYVKKADGKLYDALGNEVSWTDAGQLFDESGNIIEPPVTETTPAENQEPIPDQNQAPPENGNIKSETSEPLTPVDPNEVNNPTTPPTEIKEVTIEQDVTTGQYNDVETGKRVDVADLSQSVVIEANNQVIDVVATVEVIDQVATAIINGEQSIVVIGDGNVINVIANILAAVSDLFVDWSQIVHVHGENNVVNAQVNVDATVKNTADIDTQTRLEINLPEELPPEVIQTITSISYGSAGSSSPAPKAPATPEIPTSIDLKMNEVLYQDGRSIIEAIEFINTGETNQTYLVGALKLRFVDTTTGNVDAIIDLAAKPDPRNKNHVIVPGEIKVKDLTNENILAMNERIDLIGNFYVGSIKVVRVFDSVECTWRGIRDAHAKEYGMSVEDVSESRNPDGNGKWTILPRTMGKYNNPYGLAEEQLFANALTAKNNPTQMITA